MIRVEYPARSHIDCACPRVVRIPRRQAEQVVVDLAGRRTVLAAVTADGSIVVDHQEDCRSADGPQVR